MLDVGEEELDKVDDWEEVDNFDGEAEFTGSGISEAFGLWFCDDLGFEGEDWSLGDEGDVGGLDDEDTEPPGEDFAGPVFRGRGVGIFEADRVVFEVS